MAQRAPLAEARDDVGLGDALAIARSRTQPEAFLTVFDRHFDAVHRYLHRRAGRDVADELAAETFAQAFAARARFEPRSDGALPWLYGIATNLLRRHHRSEERRLRAYARTGRDDHVELDVDALVARVDATQVGPRLAGALASLPPEERDAVCLVALAGLTHEQVAGALGVPGGTVASRLHRARARLRAALTDVPSPATKETP